MAEKQLREAARGEKSDLVRQLLAENPGGKNMELAAMFKDRMQQKGIKEDREHDKIAQAFANEKAAAKRKAAGGNGEQGQVAASVRTSAESPPAAEESPPTGGGGFTLDDLVQVEELAKRVGGYEQLLSLVQFMAARAR